MRQSSRLAEEAGEAGEAEEDKPEEEEDKPEEEERSAVPSSSRARLTPPGATKRSTAGEARAGPGDRAVREGP